ncbi:protein phosphatase ImpM [Photobacterium aphoticum]|uniref:Protein phosphatase ImpM n=1 Tax=Photobacterium aphoticum TaxID=754436 RepID=A0A090QNR1_9GAMM|nr:protein phosphatase ImpM [Photobacterium aphoticum]
MDSWSEWQQAILSVSREQLGEEWADCYLTSPVWHFALSPGACGKQGMVGTLMPSIDQVGRHFF